MSEPNDAESAIESDHRTTEHQKGQPGTEALSRHTFLSVGSAGLATAALASLAANAQEKTDTEKADHNHSASNPGPENEPLLDENPSAILPPPTDHGKIEPVWYSFDLTHKRVQGKTDLEFLAVFAASEYIDFSLNDWIRHLPQEMVTSHLNLDAETISKIPPEKFAVIPG